MTISAAVQSFPGGGDLLPSREARLAYRSGKAGSTAGIAKGFVQGNLAILPEKFASSFHRFCQLNPKPCPIIGMSDVGDPRIPSLGLDLDIRTDVPRYRVWRDGEVIEEPTDVKAHWRDDLVAFVLGCSFSFEEALMAEGLPIRHIERDVRVPMFRTNVACQSAGPFRGPDGGVDASLQAGASDPRGADHHRAFRQCTVLRFISVTRIRSASTTSPGPTTAMRCRSRRTRFRCSGRAASHRRR